MRKLLLATSLLLSVSLPAQTLFHYGKDSVSVREFLAAYNKNSTGTKSGNALREYLDLYIASRLKIAEAKSLGYDTLPQMVAEIRGLRQQIMQAYLNDRESVNRLVDEAFHRSGKDIRIAHIFIAARAGMPAQIADASQRANAAMDALKKGVPFAEVAGKYSEDPAAKTNGGDIGWITVFTLPYELENLAYGTAAGKISGIYQSKAGFHIFKNTGERKAAGRMKASQILLAFPADASETAKLTIKKLADSLHTRILKGDDFGKLAAAFSNDMVSAAANGSMPEFGVGQYDPVFETTVYNMKNGSVSKPFVTAHGYHIVKKMAAVPVAATADQATKDALRLRVEASDRLSYAKDAFTDKLVKEIGISKPTHPFPSIWMYSDSVLNQARPSAPLLIDNTSSLFSVRDRKVSAGDWISYARSNRHKPDGTGMKTYPSLWDEFVKEMVMDYYKANLEKFNEDFRNQLREFSEGNLFFEIMQQKVWGPAQTDSAALHAHYLANRSSYNWNESAEAVVFYAADMESANKFIEQLKKSPPSWQALVLEMGEKIAADSGRFELSQLAIKGKAAAGMITAPVANEGDNTASFTYIIKVHTQAEPRTYNEAKGLVINDYQSALEKKWMEELKQKFPVRVNWKVWEGVVKSQ